MWAPHCGVIFSLYFVICVKIVLTSEKLIAANANKVVNIYLLSQNVRIRSNWNFTSHFITIWSIFMIWTICYGCLIANKYFLTCCERLIRLKLIVFKRFQLGNLVRKSSSMYCNRIPYRPVCNTRWCGCKEPQTHGCKELQNK